MFSIWLNYYDNVIVILVFLLWHIALNRKNNTCEHLQQHLTICKAGAVAESVAHQIIQGNLLETWLTAPLSLPGNYWVWEANSWVFHLHSTYRM